MQIIRKTRDAIFVTTNGKLTNGLRKLALYWESIWQYRRSSGESTARVRREYGEGTDLVFLGDRNSKIKTEVKLLYINMLGMK